MILCSIALSSIAQDTTYYDGKWQKMNSAEGAEFYRTVTHVKKKSNTARVHEYFISGEMYSEINYSDYASKIKDGVEKRYYKNGQVREEGNYKSGKLDGNFSTYFQNGNRKRSDEYNNGNFINGKCFTSQGQDTSYYEYYVSAQFPGGKTALYQFLANEIKYPKDSQKKRIEGRVEVYFEIKEDGSLRIIRLVKTVNEEIDAESKRVTESMPKWIPASSDGVAVKSYYNLPFNFKL